MENLTVGAGRRRVVAYCRVSTEEQADQGVSLEAQRARVTAYAALYEIDVVEVVVDAGVSAKTLDRPGLARVLAMLEAGEASGILVAKLDRLTRSVRDLGDLVDRLFADGKHALLSVAENIDTRSAGGRLVLNVLGSVAQWEREAIGERTAEALGHLRSQGVRLGGEALGWRRTGERDAAGRLVVLDDDAEGAVVRRIVELRRRGCSLAGIAAMLTLEERPTKRRGRWFASTVRAVLVREGGTKPPIQSPSRGHGAAPRSRRRAPASRVASSLPASPPQPPPCASMPSRGCRSSSWSTATPSRNGAAASVTSSSPTAPTPCACAPPSAAPRATRPEPPHPAAHAPAPAAHRCARRFGMRSPCLGPSAARRRRSTSLDPRNPARAPTIEAQHRDPRARSFGSLKSRTPVGIFGSSSHGRSRLSTAFAEFSATTATGGHFGLCDIKVPFDNRSEFIPMVHDMDDLDQKLGLQARESIGRWLDAEEAMHRHIDPPARAHDVSDV